jgi:hypothetical protein
MGGLALIALKFSDELALLCDLLLAIRNSFLSFRQTLFKSRPINAAGPHRDDLRKAVREVIAFPSEQSHTAFDPASHNAEAVMLDFVNPARANRRLLGRTG